MPTIHAPYVFKSHKMQILKIDSAESTNTWVSLNEKDLPSPCLIFCREQTAGRGQRGNSWESEPGKNITASLLFHPEEFPAQKQFLISEAVALGIVDFLKDYGIIAKVKWPNDIYVGEKKICGILVEHVVVGKHITRTIAGVGININQTLFLSDAPNPVSLRMLTGKNYDLNESIEKLAIYLEKNLGLTGDRDAIHNSFLESLWRYDGGEYDFYDRKKEQQIRARVKTVSPEGILSLTIQDGETRDYSFKEVEFIL